MCLDFRPLPSELPFLHERSAPRFVLVWLKQESRIGRIHNWHNFTYFLTSTTFLNQWREANRKITRSLEKQRFVPSHPLASTKRHKDRIHFRKFQWDLQYFLRDLHYVTESGLFIWRLGSHVQVSVHAWRGSTVTSGSLRARLINRNLDSLSWRVHSSHVVCRLRVRTAKNPFKPP